EVNALLNEHIGHVATRIRELRQLEKQLKALREQCVDVREAEHCGILNELVQASSATDVRSASAHVTGSHGTRNRRRHSSTLE
ncbi:MAG: Cd(II)/Pb(II)-responsive transcriptional regulator, partial [Rubrivivax sp.]|nr:Cd(II)/Pb(II)-responsive transcriptional regulator [Rubrivivax sp.]